LAADYINKKTVYGFDDFFDLDKKNKDDFISLVDYLQNENINIIFFLPPYHPTVYNYLINNEKTVVIKMVEKFIINCANKKSIQLIGSYNPQNISFIESDFYDGAHPKYEAITRIFNSYFIK